MKKILFLSALFSILISCKKESTEPFGKSDALVEESETNTKSPEVIGKEIFEGRGNCISCHQVDTKLIGPSLKKLPKYIKRKRVIWFPF
jgi:cytochrome c